MRGEPVIELAFGLLDTLETAEAQEVRLAHIGDQTVRRLAHPGQGRNVVGMVRAHFHDGDFRVRADAEDRQRHADIVVQVPFRGRDPEMRGQDLADKLLGGRLAIRAGQADDRDFQLLPMVRRKLLQGPEGIRETEEAGVVALGIVMDDGIGGTRLEGLQGIGVSIESLALEGNEDLAGLEGPGIRIHALGGEEQAV